MAYSVDSPDSLFNLPAQLPTSFSIYGALSPRQAHHNNNKYRRFLKLLEINLNQWKHQPGRHPVRFLNPKYTYMNRQKAAEAIIEAYQKNSTCLGLQQFDILELPKSILYLNRLKQLSINHKTKVGPAIRAIMSTEKGEKGRVSIVIYPETKVGCLPHCIGTDTNNDSILSNHPTQFTIDYRPDHLIPNNPPLIRPQG